MDKLTLEHLSAYLPHEVQFISELDKPYEEYGKQPIWTLNGVHELFGDYSLLTKDNKDSYVISKCKLMLRPLTSIDLKFFKKHIDVDIEDFLINCEPEKNHFSVEVFDIVIGWTALSYEEYKLFFKHHIDVFNLILRGLAVEIKEGV